MIRCLRTLVRYASALLATAGFAIAAAAPPTNSAPKDEVIKLPALAVNGNEFNGPIVPLSELKTPPRLSTGPKWTPYPKDLELLVTYDVRCSITLDFLVDKGGNVINPVPVEGTLWVETRQGHVPIDRAWIDRAVTYNRLPAAAKNMSVEEVRVAILVEFAKHAVAKWRAARYTPGFMGIRPGAVKMRVTTDMHPMP